MPIERGNCRQGLDLGQEPCTECPKQYKCRQQNLACNAYKEYTATGSVVEHIDDREPNHYIWLRLFPGAPHAKA